MEPHPDKVLSPLYSEENCMFYSKQVLCTNTAMLKTYLLINPIDSNLQYTMVAFGSLQE